MCRGEQKISPGLSKSQNVSPCVSIPLLTAGDHKGAQPPPYQVGKQPQAVFQLVFAGFIKETGQHLCPKKQPEET